MCFFLPQYLTTQEKKTCRSVTLWQRRLESLHQSPITCLPVLCGSCACLILGCNQGGALGPFWLLELNGVYCIPEPKPLAPNSRDFLPVYDKFRALSSPQSSYSFLDCARIISMSEQVPSSDTPPIPVPVRVTLPWIGNYFCGNVHIMPSTTSLRRKLCPVLITIVSSVTKSITLNKQMRNL